MPKDDPSYNFLNKLQDSGANLTDEKLLLSQQQGWIGRNHQSLFQYTGVDEYIIDPATQNKIGPRLAGAAQATVGIVGVAGSGTLCTTGVGCVLGAVSGTVSADYAVAGVKQAVTGNAALPYGEQVLQSLGLSPQAAAYTYAALGVAPSALPAAAQSIKNIAPQLDAILLNAQSKIGQSIDDAAANLARNSTHAAGDANRVVLGKWEGDYGGYVGDAKLNGGVWYQTDPGVWDKMTKGFSDVEKTAVAWKVNESFLKQQLQAGIPKFEFVGTTIETIKAGRPSFALMEVNFLEANAAKFGYRKIENAWVKVN